MVKVFISGFGTVGQGVFELLLLKMYDLEAMGGVKVTGIMDSKSYTVDNEKGVCGLCTIGNKKLSGKCGHDDRNGLDGRQIMDMADYDVLIECTPTNIQDGGEGLKNIKHALEKGKDVITVNKGPLALKFKELSDLAEKNGCPSTPARSASAQLAFTLLQLISSRSPAGPVSILKTPVRLQPTPVPTATAALVLTRLLPSA